MLWVALQPRPLGLPCTLPVEPDAEGDDALGRQEPGTGVWREVEGWTRLATLPVSERAGKGGPGALGTALDPPSQREDGERRFTWGTLMAQ